MRRLLLIGLLLTNMVWADYFALLVETASGGSINSDKDIITMKRLLGDKYKITVINEAEATSGNIRKRLKKFVKDLSPTDTFLFYYSGHGDRFATGDEHESDSRDDFLLTSDAECTSKTTVVNVLMDDELNYLYSQIEARKVIIIDACHSADMQKGVIEDRVKRFKGCGKGFVKRGFKVNPSWGEAENRNFLHFGAAQEKESALGSPNGGEFTLALEKVIKERGNISFAQLEQEVQNRLEDFNPSISSHSTIKKSQLYTKDIFVIATTPKQETLKALLDNQSNILNVTTQKRLNSYKVGRPITIKGYLSSTKNIYLLELKGENDFKIISSKPKCIYVKERQKEMCQFDKLRATTPTGDSTVYMIQTEKPLNFGATKASIVTDEDFDTDTVPLLQQLQNMSFEMGRVMIKTIN